MDANGIYTWNATTTDGVRSGPCQITSTPMSEMQTRDVPADVIALAYHGELGLKCTSMSSLVNRYLAIYRRQGTKWQLVVTSITLAAAPQAP